MVALRPARKLSMSKREPWFGPRPSSKSATALLVLAMCLIGGAASAQTYTVIDLATLDEGSSVVVRGVNGGGTAVGGGRLKAARRGLLFRRRVWRPSMVWRTATTRWPSASMIIGIVVGGSNTATAARAFLRTAARGFARAGASGRRYGEHRLWHQQAQPGRRGFKRCQRRAGRSLAGGWHGQRVAWGLGCGQSSEGNQRAG